MPNKAGPSVNERRLHGVVITVAAVLAVAMVGAAVWAVTRPNPTSTVPPAVSSPAGDSSQTATPATSASGTVETTPTVVPSDAPSDTPPPEPSNPATPVVPAGRRIAFHIGDTLYVAGEDGKARTPMRIAGTNYALSPDGRTVAAVEKGKLVVAAVGQNQLASSPSTPGLSAESIPPVWLPDSSAVLFVRSNQDGNGRIWRLDRATGAASQIGPGTNFAVSPNGRTIAAVPNEEAVAPVITVTALGGDSRTLKVPSGDPVAIALGKDRVFLSTVSASGSSTLWSMAYDGSQKKQIVGSGLGGTTSATYGELMLSPDGTKLLFAADGDDGYSRLWTVPAAGGTATAISGLRDGYAIGWTKDGKGILFIEGNDFQGQTTALWRSDLTGNRRSRLVQGAMH